MRSLPSILKYFMKPKADDYQMPDTEKMAQQLEEMIRLKESIMEQPSPQAASSAQHDEDAPALSYADQQEEYRGTEPEYRPPIVQADVPDRVSGEEGLHGTHAGQVTFARMQANAILQDAQEQANRLLEQARADAEEEVSRIHREAAEMGYKDGYTDGRSKGEAEAKEATRAAAERSIEEVKQFIERAQNARDAQIESLRSELLNVAIAVAEKVIHVSLKSSAEVIKRMLLSATEKLKRREWVQIYISDCDAKGLTQADPMLTSALSGLSDHVKIVPMREAEAGTCVIEMPDQIIDASAATQIENIRSIIRDSGF